MYDSQYRDLKLDGMDDGVGGAGGTSPAAEEVSGSGTGSGMLIKAISTPAVVCI